jgi:hypothetical protein
MSKCENPKCDNEARPGMRYCCNPCSAKASYYRNIASKKPGQCKIFGCEKKTDGHRYCRIHMADEIEREKRRREKEKAKLEIPPQCDEVYLGYQLPAWAQRILARVDPMTHTYHNTEMKRLF